MDNLMRFKRSYALLQRFFERWLKRVEERCKDPVQRKAGFYVWARYSMSMRTIAALLDPHLIPDLAVICRCCLEFDVTLEAVITDEEMAREYLNFDKHSKARYLQILSKQGDIERMLLRRGQFEKMFGESPEKFGRTSWCAKKGGMSGLMRSQGRKNQTRIYNMLSHFAHGSVWAMQMLDGRIKDPEESLGKLVESAYTAYLDSSRAFLWSAWEPLTTPEGEDCKNDFLGVMSAQIAQ